jgi:hypothetical protein
MSDNGKILCRTPVVPKRKFPPGTNPAVMRALTENAQKWVPGTVITYCFLSQPGELAGSEAAKKIAREGFDAWQKLGISVKFEEITDPAKAMARIGFKPYDGYWSFIGREILNTHYNCHSCGAGQFPSTTNPPRCYNCGSTDVEVEPRTMNLDGASLEIDSRGKDVPCHEMGHTISMPHEHQSPFAGIVWDEKAVIKYFSGPPNNWPEPVIRSNILDKLSEGDVAGSPWDPDSIMEYEFGPKLILEPEQYNKNGLTPAGGISPVDGKWIKTWYPPSQDIDEIKLNEPVSLKLQPGDGIQLSFIAPDTRQYDFQTFGESDTVMVLFEEVNEKRNQLDADDDSGENWNAHIRYNLEKGKKYLISIRLYWNYSGDTTLKVW